MEFLNIADNCRACQDKTQEESQIHIFVTLQLPDIYRETTSLDIYENDGLPQVLCFNCYNRLLEAYNFRKMCSAAALHFQQILSMEVPETKYTPPEHLNDLIDIKPDPDILDAPKSSLRNLYYSPHRDNSLRGISDKPSIDEKPLKIIKTDPDDDASLIFRQSKETNIKQEESHVSQEGNSRTMGKSGNLVCSICNSKFHRKSRMEMHMREKHLGLKPCVCKICGKELSLCGFKHHMQIKHGEIKEFPCPECDNQYKTEMGLQHHMKKSHDPENPILPRNKVWMCEICGKEFETFSTLRSHRTTDKVATENTGTQDNITGLQSCTRLPSTGNQMNMCEICGVENITADDLKIHMNIHIKVTMWSCELCPYKARKQQSLKDHVKVVHQGVKDFHCSQCDRSFARADHLKLHLLRHEGIRKFKCTICGITKVSGGELKSHMNTHTKEKLWSCEYCTYKSPVQRNMIRHVKVVHHGLKDFHCPHCERSFGKAESLRNHVMTHTGEKPHTCIECGKGFIKRPALKTHMNTHHKSKPNIKLEF